MSRPIVKNIVRLGLFAAAITTVACSSPTEPTSPVNIKEAALKDTTAFCASGWTLVGGRWVCGEEG